MDFEIFGQLLRNKPMHSTGSFSAYYSARYSSEGEGTLARVHEQIGPRRNNLGCLLNVICLGCPEITASASLHAKLAI